MRSLRTLLDALSDRGLTKHAQIVFSRTGKEETITITFRSDNQAVQSDEVEQWFKEDDEGND